MELLTIFTPTYNRAKYLIKLFESLEKQKNKNFEWIIIDDDSSDNSENVVKSFKDKNPEFRIIYQKQQHGGKHRAINRAVNIAKGDFFFIVDSDDKLTDNAVKLIFKWVESIEEKPEYCGVAGLRISPKGCIWGGNPNIKKGEWVDSSSLEREKYNLNGDKSEVYRTDVLRDHPFPEFEDEFFVTEAVVWDAIAADGYKIRWYNEPIYICDYHEDGLTANGANEIRGHINNYQGYLYYINQCKRIKKGYDFVINFSDYEKTANYKELSYKKRAEELKISFFRYCVYKFVERPIFLLIRKFRMYRFNF